MSRGQETQAFDTASSQNQQYNTNAQTAFNKAQGDVTDYEDQLAKYAAGNPYGEGGEYETDTNRVLANTADAGAQSAGQAIQGAAVRTGENAGGAIAATEAMEEANQRNLGGQEATAQQQRIGQQAGYNKDVLSATAVPEQMESSLSGQQAGAANSALGEETKAGETPSFLDTLGSSFAQSFGSGIGSLASGDLGKIKCHVAARIFGGWGDKRTVLVRLWLHCVFARRWYGRLPVWAYGRWSHTIAEEWMPQSRAVDWAMRCLFAAALAQAEIWLATRPGREAYERHEQLVECYVRGPRQYIRDEFWHWAFMRSSEAR